MHLASIALLPTSRSSLTSSVTLPLHGEGSPQWVTEDDWRHSFDAANDLDTVLSAGIARTFKSIGRDTDEWQFVRITSNRRHLLHPLIPPQQVQHYLLRKCSDGYKLQLHTSSLNDRNSFWQECYTKILIDFYLSECIVLSLLLCLTNYYRWTTIMSGCALSTYNKLWFIDWVVFYKLPFIPPCHLWTHTSP